MKLNCNKQLLINLGRIFLLVILLIAWLYSFFQLNKGDLRDSLITIIPFLICLSGHSFKGLFDDMKMQRKASEEQKTIGKRMKRYFPDFFPTTLEYSGSSKNTDEVSILQNLIEDNWLLLDKFPINHLILCYFCKKWAETENPEDFTYIQKYAGAIGIKYAKLDEKTQLFFDLYQLSMKLPSNEDYRGLLNHFINNYNLESIFYDLKNELKETKSLHSTLVELIKYGELSNYGISKETLKKLNRNLRKEFEADYTYLVLTNGVKDELKTFVKSFPGLGGSIINTRNLSKFSRFGLWIVQLSDRATKEEFMGSLKKYTQGENECIVWVSPIDFINSDLITNFENKKFSNKRLHTSYEVIQSFRSRKKYDSALLWNEITKSSITADELMGIIPFNVFCNDIFTTEQTYFIKNYPDIKEKLNINTLTQWSNVNSESLVECLISFGYPNYTYDEKLYLNFDENSNNEKLIRKRLKKLSTEIVAGSKKFASAMNLNQSSDYWSQFA